MIDRLESHSDLWGKINQMIQKNRLPQALLFVGPRHASVLQFVHRFIATVNCQGEEAPCGRCQACHLLLNNGHPDLFYIRPETAGGAIKIEQIRFLQQTVYKTPQCGTRSFIIIEPADKMNTASANALLKILEDPPKHVFFILIADQISSIPATVISRCQMYFVPPPKTDKAAEHYVSIGQYYPPESSRANLVEKHDVFIALFQELISGHVSPCTAAAKWSSYAFEDVLWMLYLVTSQAIHDSLVEKNNHTNNPPPLTKPMIFLNQLEKINAIYKKMYHNITMNQTLALEDLLVGYLI